MIDEDDVTQAVFDYGLKNYAKRSQELYKKYVEEFPEKNWEKMRRKVFKSFLKTSM